MGNEQDMREWADVLGSISETIAAVYAERGGGEPAAWRDVMRAEKWYTPQEAVDAGLADEVVAPARQAKPPAPDEPAPDEDEPGMRAAPVLVVATVEDPPPAPPTEPDTSPDTSPDTDTDTPPEPPDTAAWTAAVAGLLQPTPAPSTVDELLNALVQKGNSR
jgi:hypothetical protein